MGTLAVGLLVLTWGWLGWRWWRDRPKPPAVTVAPQEPPRLAPPELVTERLAGLSPEFQKLAPPYRAEVVARLRAKAESMGLGRQG